MKALFLTYLYLEEANGITKKILAQVDALKNWGIDIHLCHFIKREGIRYWAINGEAIDRIGTKKDVIARTISCTYHNKILSYIKREGITCLYLRYGHNGSPFFNDFLGKLRKAGVRILLEIPTYPYDGENSSLSLLRRIPFYMEKSSRKSFHKYIERVVTFSDDKEIFGIPTINISNAVDIRQIPLRTSRPEHRHFCMTGVANTNFWHGFDRMIAGVAEYYNGNPCREVCFNIVGEGPVNSELKELCKQKGVGEHVHFLGPKQGEELNAIMAETDIRVGCLACHRKNIAEVKSLKNVEYAARGIPFVYSEGNNDFDNKPYVIKVPQDESPIDISGLIEQFEGISISPEAIRQTVSHLTWYQQMKIIADYMRSI